METLDIAFNKLNDISNGAISDVTLVSTEEDTKLQIITRILTEPLGWDHSDISMERKLENGYSDYLMKINGRSLVLIEAKRAGSLDVNVVNKNNCRTLKLSGPALKKIRCGINQAAHYASPYGIPLAVLTDGLIWIVFKPYVIGEHFLDKEAYVFPSIQSLSSEFSTFYELLSKEAIRDRRYMALFDRIHNPRMMLSRPLVAPIPETEITRMPKSEISFDLDRVFDTYFNRMRGDNDPDLLIECFVETRESRIADYSLEKMTKRILGNIAPENKDVDKQLSHLIDQTVQQDYGTNVFIIGPTGSGKTTFLDRFFRKTLLPQIRDKVVPIRLNCLDASGTLDTVQKWMTEKLIKDIEAYSFTDGNPTWEELLGLYFSEYTRRAKGVDAVIYVSDREKFREKFSEYMDSQVEKDREGYLRRLLSDLVENRKKLPLIIVDNTDGFELEVKKAIFQFAQALRRHAKHCMVIHPVTDKSAWSFAKTDIFQMYSTRSFFLPTPPPREVFRKRIEYIKNRIAKEKNEKSAGRYLSARGIRISIPNLDRFASELEKQFVNHERASKLLGELSNYNIRTTLDLGRRIITSALFKIEDILAAHASGNRRATTWAQFMNALLKGDNDTYRAVDVPEIVDVFHVDEDVRQSPLLNVRILALLQATANAAKDVEGRHLSVSSIQDYFEAWGCTEASVDLAVKWLLNGHLLEKFDPSTEIFARDEKVAITYAGRAHLKLALEDDVYFEQMALTTPISSDSIAAEIREVYRGDGLFSRKRKKIRSVFAQHLISADAMEMTEPAVGEQYAVQRDVRQELERHVSSKGRSSSDRVRPALDSVIATVDWFAPHLGYGFADCSEVDGQVFLHKDVLSENQIDYVADGDELICSIEFKEKGPQIYKISKVNTRDLDILVRRCRVVRLFHDRGYGFVRALDSSSDNVEAFFHFSLVDDSIRGSLMEDDVMKVEIKNDPKGRGLQVRKIIDIERGLRISSRMDEK